MRCIGIPRLLRGWELLSRIFAPVGKPFGVHDAKYGQRALPRRPSVAL